MKTAAYLRVSTESQVGPDKYGLDAQRADIEAHAARHGLDIVRWYADEGISGATMDRPALTQMLEDAAAGAFECVLVAKLDRLARDLFGQLFIEDLLTGKDAKGKKKRDNPDVILASAAEPQFKQDPTATLLRQMLGAFAEYERELIRTRLMGGRTQKAKHGGFAGHKAPLGYRAAGKQLRVDEKEAEAVQLIFDLRSQPGKRRKQKSLRTIAAELNGRGYRTRNGCEFSATAVKRVLDRKGFYAGTYSFAGVEANGRHRAIL